MAWLNHLADEFAQIAPDGTPPLWVTSVARSVEHQRHLKSLGYIALLPSAHCVGYAADIEMDWYRRFRAHRLLRGLLLDRQRADEVNVIDEGQAWHVCLRPDLVQRPRQCKSPPRQLTSVRHRADRRTSPKRSAVRPDARRCSDRGATSRRSSLDDCLLAGTQRLRIVDPVRAIQPWISADGRWLLCYNGEIYNHRALRAELRALGHQFRSRSDTEVILQAFAQWGENAVRRLRGEFAFAISERSTGRTYLARDPVGVKPLYWSTARGCLHVASEIKALVPPGAVVREVPPGSHGWATPGRDPMLARYTDLLNPDARGRRAGHRRGRGGRAGQVGARRQRSRSG